MTEKKIVLVDIDGTVAKMGDRLKHILSKEKDWDAYYSDDFDDEPIQDIVELVGNLSQHYTIVFCTARSAVVRLKTITWCLKHFGQSAVNTMLLMRKENDHRVDTIVKPESVKEAGIALKDIAFVLEDRTSIVKKWRKLGLTVLQVADGDF